MTVTPLTGTPFETREKPLLLGASLAAVACLIPVLLYQSGAIAHLPDPPSDLFASDKITSSAMAHPGGIPDSIPGLMNFGATAMLVAFASNGRVGRKLLGVKLLLDGCAAAFNTTRQIRGFGRVCSWCMGTAAAAFVAVYAGREIVAGALDGNWRAPGHADTEQR